MSLAIYRIVFALYLLLFEFPRYRWLSDVPDSFFLPPLSIAAFFTTFPSPWFYSLLMALISFAIVALLVGFRTPVVSIALAAMIIIGNSFDFSLGKIDTDILSVALLVMAGSGWGRRLSVDAAAHTTTEPPPAWPLALLALLLGLAMMTAAVGKATTGWLDLSTQAVKGHLIQNMYVWDRPAAAASLVLSVDSRVMWEVMDWGTVFLEAAFLPAALSRRAMRVVCAVAVLFHAGIHFLMVIFFISNILAYAAFIEWRRLLLFRPVRALVRKFGAWARGVPHWQVVVGGLLLTAAYRVVDRPIATLDRNTQVILSTVALLAVTVSLVYLGGWLAGRWTERPIPALRRLDIDRLSSEDRPLVLFDGTCGLCNRWVDFVLRADRKNVFKFAALQSSTGRAILAAQGESTEEFATMLLVRGARVDRYSTAALEILRRLRNGWSLLYVFILVPPPLRDLVYEFVAARRLLWFGQLEACRVPTAEHQARFL